MHVAFCNAVHCTVTVRRNESPLEQLSPSQSVVMKGHLAHAMTIFVYRCPKTGKQVQEWTDDPPVADDPDAYQLVECIACSLPHWVNPRTGRVLEPTSKHVRS
jgi:hypothetical protein